MLSRVVHHCRRSLIDEMSWATIVSGHAPSAQGADRQSSPTPTPELPRWARVPSISKASLQINLGGSGETVGALNGIRIRAAGLKGRKYLQNRHKCSAMPC